MRCRKIKRLLGPFLDKELSQRLKGEVTTHLKRCPACRARLESIQKVQALSSQLAQAQPDQAYWSAFLPRLRSKISSTEQARGWEKVRKAFGILLPSPLPWPKLAGAVAVALLAVILGRALIRHDIQMGRIRALPKKLLTEQARIATKEIPPDIGMEHEAPGARGGKMGFPQEEAPKPTTPVEQDMSESAGEMPPSDKKMEQITIAPPTQEDFFVASEEVAQPPEQAPREKIGESQVSDQRDEMGPTREDQKTLNLDRATEGEKAPMGMVKAARFSGAEHWRQQILLWQNSIDAQPRGEQLGQAYFRLAENWYQMALITTRREDLLQAVEAQRAALDFTTEEAPRRLLRSRIQTLEKQLRKK